MDNIYVNSIRYINELTYHLIKSNSKKLPKQYYFLQVLMIEYSLEFKIFNEYFKEDKKIFGDELTIISKQYLLPDEKMFMTTKDPSMMAKNLYYYEDHLRKLIHDYYRINENQLHKIFNPLHDLDIKDVVIKVKNIHCINQDNIGFIGHNFSIMRDELLTGKYHFCQ